MSGVVNTARGQGTSYPGVNASLSKTNTRMNPTPNAISQLVGEPYRRQVNNYNIGLPYTTPTLDVYNWGTGDGAMTSPEGTGVSPNMVIVHEWLETYNEGDWEAMLCPIVLTDNVVFHFNIIVAIRTVADEAPIHTAPNYVQIRTEASTRELNRYSKGIEMDGEFAASGMGGALGVSEDMRLKIGILMSCFIARMKLNVREEILALPNFYKNGFYRQAREQYTTMLQIYQLEKDAFNCTVKGDTEWERAISMHTRRMYDNGQKPNMALVSQGTFRRLRFRKHQTNDYKGGRAVANLQDTNETYYQNFGGLKFYEMAPLNIEEEDTDMYNMATNSSFSRWACVSPMDYVGTKKENYNSIQASSPKLFSYAQGRFVTLDVNKGIEECISFGDDGFLHPLYDRIANEPGDVVAEAGSMAEPDNIAELDAISAAILNKNVLAKDLTWRQLLDNDGPAGAAVIKHIETFDEGVGALNTVISKNNLKDFIKKGLPLPVSLVYVFPDVQFSMGMHVYAETGPDTGNTAIACEDVSKGYDPRQKRHMLNMTMYTASFLKDHRKVDRVLNTEPRRYLAGGHVTVSKNYRPRMSKPADGFCILAPPSFNMSKQGPLLPFAGQYEHNSFPITDYDGISEDEMSHWTGWLFTAIILNTKEWNEDVVSHEDATVRDMANMVPFIDSLAGHDCMIKYDPNTGTYNTQQTRGHTKFNDALTGDLLSIINRQGTLPSYDELFQGKVVE